MRLPVNELMARVRDVPYKLNYFVDSSEKDFVKQLVGEINDNSFQEEISKSLPKS